MDQPEFSSTVGQPSKVKTPAQPWLFVVVRWPWNNNKTKYFRLRLSDKVSTERPETDLRLTWSHPEESDAKRWRIRALDKLGTNERTNGRTNIVTPWAPWRSQKYLLLSSEWDWSWHRDWDWKLKPFYVSIEQMTNIHHTIIKSTFARAQSRAGAGDLVCVSQSHVQQY